MKSITRKQLEKFHKAYHENTMNKVIENAIYNNGIDEVCLNHSIIEENQPIFNIELPKAKAYDQKQSGRCWCYATINMIKYNVAQNMNVKVEDLDLSVAYLTFFDRLEKSNNVYENVITSEKFDFEYLKEEKLLLYGEGGQFIYARELIKKYGLMPAVYMKDSISSSRSNKLNLLFQEKIKSDCKKIIELKKEKASMEKIRQEKEKMLEENYIFLSKILGEPISEFNLEYYDKEHKLIQCGKMTPLEFKERFLTINLDDYVSLYHLPRYNRTLYHKYIRKYHGNVIGHSKVEYVCVTPEEIAKCAIKQLKDGCPVPFICPTAKYWYRKDWILDTRIFNYQQVLDFTPMTKADEFDFYDVNPNHVMTFVGVHVVNRKPIRWKVENSWGTIKDMKQYMVMNQSYFEECVLEVIIHKKYLSKKIKEAFNREPEVIEVDEW